MGEWEWLPDQRVYRNARTGQTLTAAELRRLRDAFLDELDDEVRADAARAARNETPAASWAGRLGSVMGGALVALALLGRGGRDQLTERDELRVSDGIARQQQYLSRFQQQVAGSQSALAEAERVARQRWEATDPAQRPVAPETVQPGSVPGTLSPEAVAARAALYPQEARREYEASRAASFSSGDDTLDLPAMPGDFTCLSNCRCGWAVEEFPDRWEATWECADDPASCDECVAAGERWAPYVQPKQGGASGSGDTED